MPPVRLPFFAPWLRFSPLATWWIADRRTHLQAARIGPATLVGFPGDYSGHLPTAWSPRSARAPRRPSRPASTATTGGYLVSSRVFRDRPCYETRWMSFYGPWAGEYLNDLAGRMVDRLSGAPLVGERPADSGVDAAPRVALAALLGAGVVVGWGRRREFLGLARGYGWATVAVASAAVLAFEVAPGGVDWAGFGLPAWSRMAGVMPGAYALAVARKRPASAALPFMVGCALLSASWPAALMIARGWAKSGLKARPSGAMSAR